MHATRSSVFLIVSLGILNALTPFTIDLYLPAFPQIAADLGVPISRMSLTVSVYFIGFALGQVLYGPLLDRFGRKPPICGGLALYLLATLGCMLAPSFEVLLLFRFVSALGGSAASVGAVAMVRDYFPGKDSARVFALLMLVLSVSPMLAPSIGSVMAIHMGWRPLFAALAALALVDVAIVLCAFPRVYAPDTSVSLRPGPIVRTFRDVLRVPQFRTYAFSGALSFAGLFVFVSGSPAAFMDGFGVSVTTFGLIFAILAGGMIVGGQLNHVFLRHSDSRTVFRRALRMQVLFGAIFFLGAWWGGFGLWQTVAVLFLFLLCAGVTSPNSAALALERFTKNVGSASSLLGFLQLGMGAVAAALLGVLNIAGTKAFAVVLILCSGAGWLVLGLTNPDRHTGA
jgi:DHA1 family bicyclomycin/chloramphenicol resistance-like MFS transporter